MKFKEILLVFFVLAVTTYIICRESVTFISKEETALQTQSLNSLEDNKSSNKQLQTAFKNIAKKQEELNLQLRLAHKEKTFDAFLKIIAIFLAAFSILITVVLALAAFFGIKELSSIRKGVDEDINSYKTNLKSHIDNALSTVSIQEIIKQTMESTYKEEDLIKLEERCTTLENYIKELRKAIKENYALPELPEKLEEEEKPPKNAFEDNES